ncbi:MAG: penicillin-binding transpeptidase domain-containing protein [Ilumatobacter sp.]|uniref:penicillin-binding transpeptidase domain-containing protein n=1 Tax=Ilumatobacter sp. TaxID=1967498 RepID=UPI0026045A40|nr:penicillin-binding transpeptidase domain-containing protein [Ilumatobacter sp.]MDJ0771273.1 penicillin-binding transpeptidase domain-containing protein [Ilumatobacter sp.]
MAVDRRAARLGVLALVGVILFGLLGVRLWFLQTVKADELQESVTFAKTRTVRIAPERGRIFDVDGRILADNERILTVAVDWQLLRRKSQREEIFNRLSGWVQVPVEEMERRFDAQIDSPFLPFPIKRDVDEPTAFAILERVEDFPGVEILTEWKRVYPYAPHASHVVGYMGAITPEQVDEKLDEGYLLNERIGQFGVERSMEAVLHGTWGYKKIEVDAANRPVRVLEEVPPINGFDVQLTIDLDYQQYVEQAIETTLKARRTQEAPNPKVTKPNGQREKMDTSQGDTVPYKAPAASGLIMDYTNGDIIAMASYPSFDNRWFEAGLSSTKFQEIFPVTDDPDRSILVNRAVQGRYNLGSTFKPFTAFAALNTGLITSSERFNDTGTYRLYSVDQDRCDAGLVRCEYKNATCGNGRPCVYGSVDVEDALAVSSDAFFYRIGEDILERNGGLPVLQDEVEKFGFGADSGVELPFEFDGTVPDKELKRLYAERGVISEDEGRGFYVGDNVQLSIGQGLLSATPLHLANGYAAIANRGFLFQPSVVKAIWNPGVPDGASGFADFDRGTIFEDLGAPELIRQIAMPDDIRDPIVDGLRRVVVGGGVTSDFYHKTTGEYLFFDYPDEAIPIAGKTGTAQGANNYPWNDSSAFTGFSVDDDHPYVVTAYLEKAGYGSQAAAPVVKCTFLALSGLTATDPVVLSEPLSLDQTVAAPPQDLANTGCWSHREGNGVLTQARDVE